MKQSVADLQTQLNQESKQAEEYRSIKPEIEQLKEQFEELKSATRGHINNQVKESTSLEGVKLNDVLMELLYKEDKARLDKTIAEYKIKKNMA